MCALDVTDSNSLPVDHPLWTFDDIRITPHNAGHMPKYCERLSDGVADNVAGLGESDRLQNRVV